MSCYYGFHPLKTVDDEIRYVLTSLSDNSTETLYPRANRLSVAMTDEIIDNLLLHLVDALQAAGGEGHGLIRFLGGFIKTTMHGLLKVMLGHPNNKELAPRADFIRGVHLNLPDDQPRLGFAIPADLHKRFIFLFDEIDAGNGKQHTAAILKAFEEFIDLAIIHFYDDFIASLNLGFLLKKGAQAARGQIHIQSISTFKKLIPSLSDNELKAMSVYLRKRVVAR